MTQEPSVLDEERRLITVLYADLVGYTSVSEARDPELIFEALNLCMGRLGEEITRFGGYVDKVVGDEIIGLFGAPRAQEDDAGKAIAAGLAMQRALEELSPQLEAPLGQGFQMRVGINTGLVVAGAVGPGGYTATGDAMNVGARLEKAADPGHIMAGDATRRLARRQFRWGERQELTVKGRTEPVVCYTVEGHSSVPLRLVPAPSQTPFVGRSEHLGQIKELWEAAAKGKARVLQLVGETGVGKTRLLAHLFAEAGPPPEHVLYTRTDTPPRTFGPLIQLLPSMRENLPEGFEERIEALARTHEDLSLPEVEPDWLVEGLESVMRALAATGPVAFVLDDMHRADRATVDIVDKLLPRIADLPVLTLLLRQPTGARLRRVSERETVTLEPLAPEQATALVAGVGPELSEEAVAAIVARAGGNPLYLEMLATAAVASPEGAAVSESLQTAVVSRVDELEDTSRLVLREASVFGQSFYEEPLKLTTTVSEGLYETLEHLCRIGLLDTLTDVRNPGYQFRHTLVQEVMYEGLLLRQRVELHRRAAEALELAREEGMEVEPEQLAFQYREAGDTERAASYHLAAAERADQLRAPVEARKHRRAANRLLNMASLAGLYATHGQPSLSARAGAIALQAALAAILILPLYLVVATRRPAPDVLTLGLPFEIIDFNLSAVFLAVVLGGMPLLVAGIAFAHVAVPSLMRRHVSPITFVGVTLAGWGCGLLFVLLGFGVLIGLLRLNLLDRLSSMYVGGATLQLLLGDYSLVITVLAGTFVVAVVWTALLRIQARGWARLRRSSAGPRQMEEGRRWAAVRQLGLMAMGVGTLTIALLAAYQFGLLPNGDVQPTFSASTFGGLLVPFVAMSVGGAGTGWFAGRQLRAKTGANQLGLFGFEVPLVLALVFGLVVWFGMRQAVIVSANEVDTPGDLAAFNRAIDVFPDLGMGHYLRGERYLAASDFEKAEEDLTRAIELDSGFPASYLARGRVLIALAEETDNVEVRAEFLERAAEDGTALIELRPGHPGGWAIRAWARFQLSTVTDDVEASLELLKGAGDDIAVATGEELFDEGLRAWDAFFIRCLARAAIADSATEPGTQLLLDAMADCERVLELNPGHIVSLDQLAIMAFELGNYDQSIDYTRQLLEIQPDDQVALANLGEIYSAQRLYKEAEEVLDTAVDLAPEYARAHLELGLARLYLDDPEALAALDRAVELYWSDPEGDSGEDLTPDEPYASRMYVAGYIGEYEIAIDDANSLIDLGFETPFVLTRQGLARLGLGDLDGGLADIERALARDSDYVPGYDARGYAYFLLGDYERAGQDLLVALDRGTNVLTDQEAAELFYHRGLVLQAQQERVEAKNQFDQAISLVAIPAVRQQIEAALAALAAEGAAGP